MFQKIERKVTVVFFFMVMMLPTIFVNKKEGAISLAENRALASTAKLYNEDGTYNKKYFQDVEKWYNDNLGFRDSIVKLNGILKYYVFNSLNGMRLGRHGELAPFNDQADYMHTNLLSDEKLDQIAQGYQTIYEYLNSCNIDVYYMQLWDKHTICPEQYPETIRVKNTISLCDQVENALINKTDITVIPMKDKLLQAKSKYNIFGTWADPWHWVPRGGYLAYEELIGAINANNQNRYKVLTEDDFDITERDMGFTYYGCIHKADYEEMFTLKEPHALSKPEKFTYYPEGIFAAHTMYYENNAVDNDTTVLIFGDSYFVNFGIIPDLAESFHTTIIFNGNDLIGDRLVHFVEAYEPDIVIIENAERCNSRFFEVEGIASSIRNREYHEGEKILFESSDSNSDKYIIDGFSDIEENGRWINSKKASLVLATDFEKDEKCIAEMDLGEVYNEKQLVSIYIGNKCFFSKEVSSYEKIKFSFDMPNSNILPIKICTPEAISPFSIGDGLDVRDLSLKVKQMAIKRFNS